MIQFKVDATDAKAFLNKIGNKGWDATDPKIVKHFARFLARMIWEANNKYPRTPHLTGDLRGSASFKQRKGGKHGIKAMAGFQMPYAAKMHEGEEDWNWSEPGVGPKFLEKKFPEIQALWGEAVADMVREILRGERK